MTRDQPLTDRRRFLAAAAFATTGVLAGCAGGGSDGDNGGTDSADDETDDGGEEEEEEEETPMSTGTDEPMESTPSATQTETAAPTETPPSGPYDDLTGSVGSQVSNLTITDWEGRPGYYQEELAVRITIANEGNQPTDVSAYYYLMTLFDAEGTDITEGEGGGAITYSGEGVLVRPGSSGTLTVSSGASEPLEEIASFEITIACESLTFEAEGAYCQ